MPTALLFVLQAAAGQPPTHIDLMPPAARPCPLDTTDIVVCGRRDQDRFRLRALPATPDAKPIRAETGVIGDLKASATVDQVQMPNGQISTRAMLNLKLPF